MKVAVTGATGFIGHHLCRELTKARHEVIATVRQSSNVGHLESVRPCVASLEDAPSLTQAFAGCDAVFHLAGAVDFGIDLPRFHRVNVVGTRNVIQAARSAGVRRLVHCSSIVAVGASRQPQKLNESTDWNLGHLCVPYVTTKRRAEEVALAANGPDLEVVVVNPSCVLGPDDFSSSEFGTLCRRFWKGRLPIHFGGGNNFVDVRDVAAGMIAAMQRGRSGERYLLSGANRSMTAFFSDLARVAGMSIPRMRLPTALGPAVAWIEANWSPQETRAYLSPAQARLLPWFFYCDSGKAARELGFRARPLSATLADAFAFWRHRKAA